MRLRHVLVSSTLLVAGAVIGATTQQFASATISSGPRPVFVPIETCRVADTRPAPNTVGPRTSPLGTADTMLVDAQQTETDCVGRIPTAATALSLNITALNATSDSFLTVWADGDRPTSSALNPTPGQRVFNSVTTELAADQTFRIFNNRGATDLFVDVNGYYEDHNHDDRYPTRPEVQLQIDAIPEVPFEATIRLTSGTDGYTLVHGEDPGLDITSISPGVFRLSIASADIMQLADCVSAFSDIPFSVYKANTDIDPGPGLDFRRELQLIQPDGTPLPFNGRTLYCKIWDRS